MREEQSSDWLPRDVLRMRRALRSSVIGNALDWRRSDPRVLAEERLVAAAIGGVSSLLRRSNERPLERTGAVGARALSSRRLTRSVTALSPSD